MWIKSSFGSRRHRLVTPRPIVLIDKLTVSQLVKRSYAAFYGTRSSITMFTTARNSTVSWAPSTRNAYKEMKIKGHGEETFENTLSPLYSRILRWAFAAVMSLLLRFILWRENEPGFTGAELRRPDVGNLSNGAELDCISCYHERRP